MAFEWLITPENRIEVIEYVKNRDDDHIADLVIGYGYGVFRGQTAVEYISQNAGDFNHVGVLIDYNILPDASVTIDGKVYKAEYNIPGVIVGIVSDEYAACYGATEEEIKSGEKVAVGLVGRLHVNVTGPTVIGQDIMVSYRDKGLGEALFGFGHKIGKVLETTEEKGIHKVLCLINLS